MSEMDEGANNLLSEDEQNNLSENNVQNAGTSTDDTILCSYVEADPISILHYENDRNPHGGSVVSVSKKKYRRPRTSFLWTKFTIVNERENIARCNICHQRFSMSTVTNLKRHLERKHGYSVKFGVLPKKTKYITPGLRPRTPASNVNDVSLQHISVSDINNMSPQRIMLKVVGDNGEEEHIQLMDGQYVSEEVVQNDVQEHDYSVGPQGGAEAYAPPKSTFLSNMDEKTKRQRIQELQIECLENKKYNMRLEALLMEQQMNLPRSIFTQPLQYRSTQTRGTQTDVGGRETRVFYVTDKQGRRPIQQLFALDDDL